MGTLPGTTVLLHSWQALCLQGFAKEKMAMLGITTPCYCLASTGHLHPQCPICKLSQTYIHHL